MGNSAPALILYSSTQCELCHHALAIIQHCIQAIQQETGTSAISIKKIDITSDIELKKRYGWIIPVLASNQTDQQLNWPFDANQCAEYIHDHCC